MKETVKGPSARFKKKVLARWRWLAARGMDVVQAVQEIGVESTELRAWAQEVSPMMPLVVPVHAEGEIMVGGGGGLVAVLAGVVRIEGLTVADVAELAQRLSWSARRVACLCSRIDGRSISARGSRGSARSCGRRWARGAARRSPTTSWTGRRTCSTKFVREG